MALTVSQKTAKKKKTFYSLGVENRSLQLCGNLKKKTAKNNSRFQVFEFPILVSWLIDAVSAFIPPRKGLSHWARTHAKSYKVVTTFAFFIRLSSNLAGWQNSVFQKILCFLFFDFNGFWRENDVTRLTAKSKFQGMAKQINNFERT